MKKNIEDYPMSHHPSTIIVVLILVGVFLLMLLTSCESKSGQLVAQPLEKVVVIDSYNEEYDHINKDITYRKYKVKRIEFGVIDVIFDARLLEAGDTVFYRFAKHVTP